MAIFRKSLPIAALAVLAAASPAHGAVANFLTELARGHRQNIVTYGTSLTANSAWPGLLEGVLKDAFGRRKVRLSNTAGGGKDSRWGLANLEERVIRKRPDVVFIEFAINDAVAGSRLSVAESMGNLDAMISTIRAKLPDCDIVLMVMNPPTGDALRQRPRIREYEEGYREIGLRRECWLVDFSVEWREIVEEHPQRWAEYAPDGLHPKPLACREVILPRLLEKLGFSQAIAGTESER